MNCREWKTGASLCFNRRLDLEELKAAKAAGIDCVEISFNYQGYYETLNFVEKAEEYKAMAEEAGVELWSLHLPFSGLHDISQLDDERRDETMRINRELMEAASRAGVKVIVIHPSAEPISAEYRPARLVNSRKNLTLLASYAKALGMRLAVEDLPRTCLINHSDEAKYMLSDNPDLYIVFDTNHLLGQDNVEFIEAVGERIISLHVSDYDFVDERHRLPFDGKNQWGRIIRALENKGYCGPWMYELGSNEGKLSYADLKANHMKLCEIAETESVVIDNWHTVWVYDRVCAQAEASGAKISTKLNENEYSLARFEARKQGIVGNSVYRMSFDGQFDEQVRRQIYVHLYDAEGKKLFMVHGAPDFEFKVPEGTVEIEVVACFTSFNGGSAFVDNMTFERVSEPRPHMVKLAAAMISYEGGHTPEKNFEVSMERIDAAAAEGADLILLTETYNTRLCPVELYQTATMDSIYVTALRDKARQHKMFVAASVRLDRGDGMVSNTVLIYDRKGNLAGQYTKTHLTMGETWGGHVAGEELPVFDTEIGRIGVSTCWDLFFPEHARALFMNGVDIILNPTAGKCPYEHAACGYANGAIIVTAQVTNDPTRTRITGRDGEDLATADPEKGFAIAEVDLNAYSPRYNLSALGTYTDPRFVFMGERRPDLYGILCDEKAGYNYDSTETHEVSEDAKYYENWAVVKNNTPVDATGIVCGNRITAKLHNDKYSLVRFFDEIDGIEENSTYRMTFNSVCEDGVRRNVYYDFKDADGKTLFMGHGAPEITFNSPEGAKKLAVTVCFSSPNGGSGWLSEMAVEKIGVPEPKKVKLAASMLKYEGGYTAEKNLEFSLAQIDAAADKGADLVLLTETYNTRFVYNVGMQGASTMDSPYVTKLADKAKEHGIYVAASIRLLEDGYVSNTALLFGRNGELVGKYCKTHHTTGETWSGLKLGNEIPVFDTDIGRVGFSICWDLFFPEHARVMFMKGVDIILNPTAGLCKWQHAASAYANGAFIVTANTSMTPEYTRITDRKGDDIAVADEESKIAIAEVDINEYNKTFWLSAPGSWTDSRFVFMGERRPDLYGEMADARRNYNV